jgi:hypothetical protein
MRKKTVLNEVSNMAIKKTDFPNIPKKHTSEYNAVKNNTPAKYRFADLCPWLYTSIKNDSIIPKMLI